MHLEYPRPALSLLGMRPDLQFHYRGPREALPQGPSTPRDPSRPVLVVSEERLAEIEERVATRTSRMMHIQTATVADLLAEVRRLQEAIDLHHADFVRIKAIVTAAIRHQDDDYGPAWVAVHEIDRIVR